MSYEVVQKVGKYSYIYLAEAYRNKNGEPRQKRTPIGKVDSTSGEKNYKHWYLEQLIAAGCPFELSSKEKIFSVEDLQQSTVREYGLFYFMRSISNRIGMTDCLLNSIPGCWQEVFMLACYLIACGDPFLYCEEWIHNTECLPVGRMASQRISELLVMIKPEQRESFYGAWCSRRSEDEYLALDITSTSSYSELIEDVEWGYNRDHESLPQINLCMLMGETSRLPVYQTVYSGSLKDVTTLETTLAKLDAVTEGKPVLVVLDKGFYSHRNVTRMLGNARYSEKKFIISVPFTASFARKQVESERKDIDQVENTIVVNGESMRAITKERVWSNDHKVYTHIYYNAKKANDIRENLFAHVALLRESAEKEPAKYIDNAEYKKYLNIRKSEKSETGHTVNIRCDVVEEDLSTAGWLVIISNDIPYAKKAMRIYRDKDVVEKGFLRLKCSLDLGRLRVHSQQSMQNKVFVGFVALILLSEINRVMAENDLYRSYTMKELLKILAKQRIQEIGTQRIIFPATKEQRGIYAAFDLEVPM